MLKHLQPIVFAKIKEINYYLKKQPVQSHMYVQGTFASKAENQFATDVDAIVWSHFDGNKQELYDNIVRLLNYVITHNFIYIDLVGGKDDRFPEIIVEKDGTTKNYPDPKIFEQLLKEGVINKKEYKELMEYADKTDIINIQHFM